MTGWRDRVNEAQGQQTGGSWRDRVRLGVPSTTPTVQSPEVFRDWLWNVQLANAAHYPEIAEQNYIPVEPERTLSEQEQQYLSLLRERGTLPERAINRYDLPTWVAGFNPETGEIPLPAPIVPGPTPLMRSYRRVTGNLTEPIRGLGYLASGVAVGLNALYNLARPERFQFEGTDLSRRISPPAFQEDWVDRATNFEMLHPDIVAPLTAAWNSVFGGASGINTLAGHPEWNVGPALQMLEAVSGRPYSAESESYGRMVNPVAQFAGEMTAMTVIDPLMWIPGAGGFIPAMKSSRLLLMMEEGPRLIKYAADLRNVTRYLESTRLLTSELSAVRAVGMPIGEGRNVVEAWIRGLETQGIRTPTIGEFIGWGFNQGNARVRKVLDPYGPLRRIYLAAYRMGGAQGVQDVVNMGEFRNMIRRIAVESGMTEAEVNAEAVRQIEEIWAAKHQGIREMGEPTRFNAREEVIPPQPLVTEMTPEQRAAIELNRTRDANVLIPRRAPTGEVVQEVWPEVPEGWSTPLARERVQTAPGTAGPREEVWPEVPEGWSAPLRMEDVEIPRLPTEPITPTAGAGAGYQDIRPRMETRRAPGLEEPEFGWTQEAGMQQGIFGPEEPPRLPTGEEPPIIRPLSRSETGEYVTGYREPVRQIGEISSTEPYVPNVTEPPIDSGGKYNYWRRYTPPGAPTERTMELRNNLDEFFEGYAETERAEGLFNIDEHRPLTEGEMRSMLGHMEEGWHEHNAEIADFDKAERAEMGLYSAGHKIKWEEIETYDDIRREFIKGLQEELGTTYNGARGTLEFWENPHIYGRGTSGEVREGIEQMHLFGQEAGARQMEYQIAGTVEARKALGMQPRTSQIREEFRRVVELRQNIENLYTELERRGRGMPRLDLNRTTVPDLEREWRNVREVFASAQAERMAGVRYFKRTVKAQAGIPRHIYENTNFDSLLREATIGLRDADPETVYNYAKILYEGASDALNVGPRAPLMRERAAEMLIAPLEGHHGYLKHFTDPDLEDKWIRAAARGRERPQVAFRRPKGAPPTRRATSSELERQIFHGSTRTRAFRGSITDANKLGAEGRVWIEPATKVGEDPVIHFLVEGELPGAGWIRVNKVFDTDLVRIVAARRLSASRALAGKQYLDEVMTRFGTYSPEGIPKEGGYSIFDLSDMSTRPRGGGEAKPTQRWNETFGKFSEEYQERIKHTYFEDSGTARAICRYVDISNGDAIVQDLLAIERQGWGMIKQLNTYWKAKQLYPFTAYWFRNYYDDVVRAFTWFEHLHVGDFGDSFSLIYHGKVPNRVKTWMAGQLGIDESEVTLEMVLMKMREQGIFDSGIMFDEVDGQVLRGAGRPDRVSDIAMAEMSGTNWRQRVKMGWRGNEPGTSPGNSIWNPASTNFVVDQVGKQLGMDGNNTIRLSAAFAGMREEGMTLELLGDKVRRVMIDYLDVDPLTATLRKTGLSPFITFTRQSIPLNVRALFERGGRVALRLRAFDTIDRMNRERYGDQPQPASMDAKVYMFGRNIWFKPQNFDSAFDLGEILSNIETFMGGSYQEAFGQFASKYGNPFANETISQLLNKDLFTNRAVYEESTSRNVPMFFQALGYEEEYTRFSHAMGDVWRAVREMQQLYKTARRENGLDTSYLLRKVGGLPFYNAEPGQTVYFGLKDNTILLENIGAAYTYGNWNFYNVTPNRIDRAATLLWERLALNFSDQGFFQDDPYTGEPRPATGDYNSQDELVERMQADIKGMFLLNDRWNEVSEENRTQVGQVAPFTVQELEFLENLYQSLLLTQIALTMKAVRLGELTQEQAEQRIMREYEQLATVTP